MKDHAEQDRQNLLAYTLTPEAAARLRIDRIKDEMGEMYICHPANRVKRLTVPLRDCTAARVLG